MSQDKNNLSVIDTTSITHLINELRILDTRILNRLSSADGVIVQLNETITRLSSKKNLNEALIIKQERIKNDALNAQKELSDNLQILNEILNKFRNFEKIQEQLLSEQAEKIKDLNLDLNAKAIKQAEKIKDFNLDLNRKADLYQNQIIGLKDSILVVVEKQVEDLKNQINFKIVDIDIRNLEMINQNASEAINNITAVAEWTKNVYQINILLIGFLSFFGGGIFAFLVMYFLKS